MGIFWAALNDIGLAKWAIHKNWKAKDGEYLRWEGAAGGEFVIEGTCIYHLELQTTKKH